MTSVWRVAFLAVHVRLSLGHELVGALAAGQRGAQAADELVVVGGAAVLRIGLEDLSVDPVTVSEVLAIVEGTRHDVLGK